MTDDSEVQITAAEAAVIERAVDVERHRPGGFIFVSHQATPAIRAALAELAAETGREILMERGRDKNMAQLSELRANMPSIHRSDKRGFLKNLEAIAAGEMFVRRD